MHLFFISIDNSYFLKYYIYMDIYKIPLAERIRPRTLDEFVGQEEILGENAPLRKLIESNNIISFLLWGPPGTGKTTIAHIISNITESYFQNFSAITSSIRDLKKVIENAEKRWNEKKQKTIIFVDEIHHFNKSQQDAFLPYIEKGEIIFIGATTENPSFRINSPLLSRLKVFILKPLTKKHILKILKIAIKNKERGLGKYPIKFEESLLEKIAENSYGDARAALNLLEIITLYKNFKGTASLDDLEKINKEKILYYDKNSEEHYNLISALHKSLRDSDVDAALYWTVRMLEAGEDPLYIVRRLVRFASEDIGLADPKALTQALNAKEAFNFLGKPEGYLAILQAVVYLSIAPKSNSLYKSYNLIKKDIRDYGHLPVPMVIRNAPTKFMENIGYGQNYKYAHNFKDALVYQQHLPDELINKQYYYPSQRGLEKKIKSYLDELKSKITNLKNKGGN